MQTNAEIVIGSIDDPVECAAIHERIAQGNRNLAWLAGHWSELLPHARGKFVAVAAQESHVANSPEEAWAWAKSVHPDDEGAIVQYVRPEPGPRIYADRGQMASMR